MSAKDTLNTRVIPRRRLVSASGRRRAFWVGAGLLALVALMCIFVPIFWSYGPSEIVAQPFRGPSWSHPFGTDGVGRDLFVRTFSGGRVDLLVGFFAVSFSLLFGTFFGTLAGSSERWVDAVMMRIVDGFIAFPFIVLILVLVVLVGPDRRIGPAPPGVAAAIAAFLIAGWAYYARLARGETLSWRQRDFIIAGKTLGFSRSRIVFRHLMPHVGRVTAAYAVGDAILFVAVLAALAFLGVGVQPPVAEWGAIMFEGRAFLDSAWWITVLPGVVLAITGIALSLLTDALLEGSERR